jgi:PIN domain nuclease of toxin-antitoxin system
VRNDFVVDTHALVWLLEGNPRLSTNARVTLEGEESRLWPPVIALAEACWIIERGKTSIPSSDRLLTALDADSRWTVVALNRAAVQTSLLYTAIGEMHDRLIVATAILLGGADGPLSIITRDESICASGLAPVVW